MKIVLDCESVEGEQGRIDYFDENVGQVNEGNNTFGGVLRSFGAINLKINRTLDQFQDIFSFYFHHVRIHHLLPEHERVQEGFCGPAKLGVVHLNVVHGRHALVANLGAEKCGLDILLDQGAKQVVKRFSLASLAFINICHVFEFT